MPRYLSLLQFTERGLRNLNMSTARARAFDKLAAKAGVTVEGQYWTLGRYDGALILSADDGSKVLSLLASLVSKGNVRTESLLALNDCEFDAIAGS